MEPWLTLARLELVGDVGRGKTHLELDGFGLYLVSLYRPLRLDGQPRDLEEHYRWLAAFYARRARAG